jgi:hypothetical protein
LVVSNFWTSLGPQIISIRYMHGSPRKLTATIYIPGNWNIVESGFKHHNPLLVEKYLACHTSLLMNFYGYMDKLGNLTFKLSIINIH